MTAIKSILSLIPKGRRNRAILLVSLLVPLVLALSLWEAGLGNGNLKNARGSPTDNPPPAAKPIQLQIMRPDSVQADLLGKVKSVETASYQYDAGTQGAGKGRTLDIYNQQGCILEQSSWDEKGRLKERVVSIYDAQGNFFTRKTRDANGEIVSICLLGFDPAAKQITSEITANDGSVEKKIVTSYDSFGKEHEIKYFDPLGNQTGRTTLQRDGNGKAILVEYYGRYNELQKRTTINWNSDGAPAEEFFSEDANGITTHMDFEYKKHDSQGNWIAQIKKEVFEKGGRTIGEVDSLVERDIAYY